MLHSEKTKCYVYLEKSISCCQTIILVVELKLHRGKIRNNQVLDGLVALVVIEISSMHL